MKKLKIITVVGTRPEIIRLSCVIKKLDSSDAFEHILVHTGQNYDYELNQIFFDDFGLRKPDYFLEAAGVNATQTAGQILIKIDPYYFRPTEVNELRGDARKARRELKWKPEISFKKLVHEMVQKDIEKL